MKKEIAVVIIIILLIICAILVVLNNKPKANTTEEISSNVPQQITTNVPQQDEAVPKFYDVVYNTEIDFSDTIPQIENDGKRIVFAGNKAFDLNGFEGEIKSVKTTSYDGAEEIHEITILNSDGKVFVANADAIQEDGALNLTKIDLNEKVKAIGYTNSYKAGAGEILFLTDNNEVYAVEDGYNAKKFDFENENKYGNILLDLVGIWKLDKTLTSNNFEKTYIFGTDLYFGEHNEVHNADANYSYGEGYIGEYQIIPENNIIVFSYEDSNLGSVNLIYNEATDNEKAKIAFYGNDGTTAKWTKEEIETDMPFELPLGEYTVNEIQLDDAEVSNEGCGVTLKENNSFVVDMGWGKWHSGNYEIKDDMLICRSNEVAWDGGGGPGERATDVVFNFRIINENKLELVSIDINDPDTEKLIYDDGLKIGMTYSKK